MIYFKPRKKLAFEWIREYWIGDIELAAFTWRIAENMQSLSRAKNLDTYQHGKGICVTFLRRGAAKVKARAR